MQNGQTLGRNLSLHGRLRRRLAVFPTTRAPRRRSWEHRCRRFTGPLVLQRPLHFDAWDRVPSKVRRTVGMSPTRPGGWGSLPKVGELTLITNQFLSGDAHPRRGQRILCRQLQWPSSNQGVVGTHPRQTAVTMAPGHHVVGIRGARPQTKLRKWWGPSQKQKLLPRPKGSLDSL